MLFFFIISTSLVFLTTTSSSSSSYSSSSSPLSSPSPQSNSSLNPSVLIVLVVTTLIFSITFLLLLYLKHHSRSHNFNHNNAVNGATTGSRRNSGIDRILIESLPVFQFGSLKGEKRGLECAVCLNVFEKPEYLKLLPKCNHAFHVNCVDTWLDAHSTCPLCRYRVYPEDILLTTRHATAVINSGEDVETGSVRRVSGRHSSAEVKGRNTIIQNIWHLNRISLDSSKKRIDRETRRKDGLLATAEEGRRFSHRIVVSDGGDEVGKKDDLYYLRSEMIISGSRRFSGV